MLMACAMGAVVGIEREARHKASGLRTNILICMGAALFTIMSVVLAGENKKAAKRGSSKEKQLAALVQIVSVQGSAMAAGKIQSFKASASNDANCFGGPTQSAASSPEETPAA